MVRATRKDGKDKQKPDDDLTPLQPAIVLPVLIDASPADASTPAPPPDPAPSWDIGFSGGDTGGAGAGGDF